MKNENLYDVWTIHRGSCRPDQKIGAGLNYEEAAELSESYEHCNPCEETRLAKEEDVITDENGFLQWN